MGFGLGRRRLNGYDVNYVFNVCFSVPERTGAAWITMYWRGP